MTSSVAVFEAATWVVKYMTKSWLKTRKGEIWKSNKFLKKALS